MSSSWFPVMRLKGFSGWTIAFSPIVGWRNPARKPVDMENFSWFTGVYTFQLVNAGFPKHQQYEKDGDQKVGKTHTCKFRGTPTPQISNNYFWLEVVTWQSFFQRWTWIYVLRIWYHLYLPKSYHGYPTTQESYSLNQKFHVISPIGYQILKPLSTKDLETSPCSSLPPKESKLQSLGVEPEEIGFEVGSKMNLGGGNSNTPLKFNIAPKIRQSQKETHLPTIIFQGLC